MAPPPSPPDILTPPIPPIGGLDPGIDGYKKSNKYYTL